VTAVCGGSQVRNVTSTAFATAGYRPAAGTTSWSANVRATRPGTHGVTVRCANGGVARTSLTVR
jgi:chitin-binding protein